MINLLMNFSTYDLLSWIRWQNVEATITLKQMIKFTLKETYTILVFSFAV